MPSTWFTAERLKFIALLAAVFALAVMVCIFGFSAQDAVMSDRSSALIVDRIIRLVVSEYDTLSAAQQKSIYADVNYYTRRFAHLFEYACLGGFSAIAVYCARRARGGKDGPSAGDYGTAAAAALVIGVLYAATDELHQRFSAGRNAVPADVAIDGVGVLLGIAAATALVWAFRQPFFRQVRNYLIVGFTVFFIDYALLYVFTEFCGMWYLASAACSFMISTLFNYFASMRYVFKGKEEYSRRKEMTLFYLLAGVGLAIDVALMWVTVEKIGLHYMLAKIFVMVVVMTWNFVSRKMFLEQKEAK
jgi:putative flippase GtrA